MAHQTETKKTMEELLVDAAQAEDDACRDITNSYNQNPDGVN